MAKNRWGIDIDVELTGLIFKAGSDEPVNDAIKGAVAELVQKAEGAAKIRASRHSRSGRYVEALKGKVSKKGTSGRVKAYGGKKRMGYATVHERGRFWPTTGHRFAGHKVLKTTEREMIGLAPGIIQKHVDKAAAELNR